MKIVVLDHDPAFGSGEAHGTPVLGAVSCPELEACGELVSYAKTADDELVERAQGASVLLTNKVVISAAHFEKLPDLKLVSVLATGVNVVDLDAAKRSGVTVCNVPGYSTAATAQHAIAMLLELTNHVGMHAEGVRKGEWSRSPAFSYFHLPLTELSGLKMGIFGLGAIGTQVGRIAQALGMEVFAHSRTQKPDSPFPYVSREELFRQSDVLSLHCPLTEETKHFINKDSLSLMKKTALLINASRGPVVDENALADALDQGVISGAATDVLTQEPPQSDNRLASHPRCIVTPHIAWASTQARLRLLTISAENIRSFFAGVPQNVVAAP